MVVEAQLDVVVAQFTQLLLSQPPGTVNCRTRVTEQGEVIQQKFSTESLAEYSLGTYIGSVLEATLSPPIKTKRFMVKN